MAVTLTVAELLSALRLGDTAEETAEAERLLAFATEAISVHLGGAYATAPAVAVNESAVRLTGFLFDQPFASRGDSFANAMRNSGAARMLLPYRMHRAGSTSEAEEKVTAPAAVAGVLGLVLIGEQTFQVATANEWVTTTLPAPQTAVAGISVAAPDGTETGIELFRTATLTGMGVAGGDATADLVRMFALETASDGTVLFASKAAGAHTVYLYEMRT